MVDNAVDQRRKGARIAEGAAADRVKDLGQVRVDRVLAETVRMSQVLDVLGQVAKEEDVGLADLARDFDLPILVSLSGGKDGFLGRGC